jgi:hypothetical protein
MLLSAYEQNRNPDEMADAVHRRAAQKIVEKPMTMCGHREQIDIAFLREANQLVSRIAHRELG